MRALRAAMLRVAGLFSKNSCERELSAELESHLQLHVDDNLKAGMTAEEARRQAMLKLGGLERTKENYRDQRSVPFLETLMQDLRYAARQARKNPGFTFTAVLIMALGMCASVAIFSFVDAALLKPLPYADATRLVGVYESIEKICPQCNLSYPDYLDWKRMNVVFSSLELYQGRRFMMSGPAGAEAARGTRVSDGFFRVLGVAPVLGRDFTPGEDLPSAPRTVILSYAAWQNRYGGSPDVLGKSIVLDDQANLIIGVMPRDFHFALTGATEFWTTIHASQVAGTCDARRSCHSMFGVARLKDGVSVQTALANTVSIAHELERRYPESNRGQGAAVEPLSESIVGSMRSLLLLLLVGAGLLLVIACVNVASLILVRAESRRREMALRGALGASQGRLVRQFVTEGFVLVATGSLAGLALAYGAMRVLLSLIPSYLLEGMPYLNDLGLNPRVLAFAGFVALVAGLLFSLTPSWRLASSNARQGLAEGGRGSSGLTWRRFGSNLVVVELATAVILLVGAGLLGKSFYKLLHVETGIQPDHLALLQVGAPRANYGKDEQAVALERLVINRVSSLPGVKAVGIATLLPIGGNGNTTWFRLVGRPYHGEHNDTPQREVSVDYLKTLGARLLSGRYFVESDDMSKPRVAIVNQAFAKLYFPGEDAVDKQLAELSGKPPFTTIVGVVNDIKEGPLDVETRPAIYVPFNQNTDSVFAIAVRTQQDEQSILPALIATIRQIDVGIVATNPNTMVQRIADSPSAYLHRSSAWLIAGFAVLALVLAIVGLYGVIAYSVSQRTREIGVRMALGARPGTVYRLVLQEAGLLAAIGIAAGLLGSLGAATLMSKLLFGTTAWDLPTLAAVAGVLAASALLASFIPARRAASVSPVDALRAE